MASTPDSPTHGSTTPQEHEHNAKTPRERAGDHSTMPQPAVIPDDRIAAHGPIAPPDKDESPREQHIVTTDPHRNLAPEEDDESFNELGDPGETVDLHQMHNLGASGVPAVHQVEAFRPVPWWAIGAAGLLLAWGGIYLGQYNGGWQGDVFNEEANYHPVSGPPEDPNSEAVMIRTGEKLFTANCAVCHQASGLGVAGQYPPLVGSEWVVGDAPKRLQQILLHGLQGSVHVKGSVYNNAMPAWNVTLTDKQIAQILTYVRGKLGGNSAPAITEKQMDEARALTKDRSEAWSEAELLAIPPGPIDGGAPAADATSKAGAQVPATANPGNAGSAAKPATPGIGQGPGPAPSPAP